MWVLISRRARDPRILVHRREDGQNADSVCDGTILFSTRRFGVNDWEQAGLSLNQRTADAEIDGDIRLPMKALHEGIGIALIPLSKVTAPYF